MVARHSHGAFQLFDVASTLVLIAMGITKNISKVTLRHKQDISAADYSIYVSSLLQDATREKLSTTLTFCIVWIETTGHGLKTWRCGCGAKRMRKVEDIQPCQRSCMMKRLGKSHVP